MFSVLNFIIIHFGKGIFKETSKVFPWSSEKLYQALLSQGFEQQQ